MLDLLLIGVGGHGRSILQMNRDHPTVRFLAIADLDESRLHEAGDAFGISARYQDVGDALSRSGAQAVYIATASPSHHALVKEALDRGLSVMVEKPFTLSLSAADELISLAAGKRLTLSVNQNYRFMDVVRKLRDALDAEFAGTVQYVCADFFLYYEGHPYQCAMEDFLLFEMAVHHVDMGRFLLRSDIRAVEARSWNAGNSPYRGDPSMHAMYDMVCGVPLFYTGSLLSRGLGSEWPGRWRIQCESGSLHLDDLGQGYGVYLCTCGTVEKLECRGDGVESSMRSLADFAAAVKERRPSSVSGAENRNTMEALIASSRSARQGPGSRIVLDDDFLV